jgi:hypothetical protein
MADGKHKVRIANQHRCRGMGAGAGWAVGWRGRAWHSRAGNRSVNRTFRRPGGNMEVVGASASVGVDAV